MAPMRRQQSKLGRRRQPGPTNTCGRAAESKVGISPSVTGEPGRAESAGSLSDESETAESRIASEYRERASEEGTLAERARSRASQIGYLRLLVFLALILALLWLVTSPAS